ELDARHWGAHQTLGYIHLAQLRFEAALRWVRKALDIAQHSVAQFDSLITICDIHCGSPSELDSAYKEYFERTDRVAHAPSTEGAGSPGNPGSSVGSGDTGSFSRTGSSGGYGIPSDGHGDWRGPRSRGRQSEGGGCGTVLFWTFL